MSCLHFIWKYLPFNWEIPIEVWSSIVTAAIGFLGVYMAAHPPQPKRKREKMVLQNLFPRFGRYDHCDDVAAKS
jgi:hypothetical protein